MPCKITPCAIWPWGSSATIRPVWGQQDGWHGNCFIFSSLRPCGRSNAQIRSLWRLSRKMGVSTGQEIRKTRQPREKQTSVPSPNVVKRRGLCTTCRRVGDCRYENASGRPVLHCEEYEGNPPALETLSASRVGPSERLVASAAGTEADCPAVVGLCKTCQLSESCTYSRPEGGVWHCDEYC